MRAPPLRRISRSALAHLKEEKDLGKGLVQDVNVGLPHRSPSADRSLLRACAQYLKLSLRIGPVKPSENLTEAGVTLPLSGLFMVSFGSIERGGLAMTMTKRIEMNPKVMMGKPVIRGTRIPIELILRKLGEGATEIDLLDAYPRLTKADIQAAIGYAADTVAHEETVLVGSPATRKRAKR